VADLTQSFDERLQEIDAYLDLLEVLDREVKSGRPPAIGETSITVRQQRVLYSAVYLQLYNLVEATVTWCVNALCEAAALDGKWIPADLSAELRREWVRLTARTNVFLTEEHRLQHALDACEIIVRAQPVSWPKDVQRRSNWDDDDIGSLCTRLGCNLQLSPETYKGVKQPIRDDKGPLRLIKELRNRLAHGSISFEECGASVTVDDLKSTKEKTVAYLKEVVAAYTTHIGEYRFLETAKRPISGGQS
jgi:hypothetical protein